MRFRTKPKYTKLSNYIKIASFILFTYLFITIFSTKNNENEKANQIREVNNTKKKPNKKKININEEYFFSVGQDVQFLKSYRS